MSAKNSLLLGNGFNINLGVNTSYRALYENMAKKKFLRKYHLPSNKEFAAKGYDLEEILCRQEEEHKALLQYHLFDAIIEKCRATIHKHTAVMEFLQGFDTFFTTNYDPLLYHNLLLIKPFDEALDQDFHDDLVNICDHEIEDFLIKRLSKKDIYSIAKKVFAHQEKHREKKIQDYMDELKKIKEEDFVVDIRDGFMIRQSKTDQGQGKEGYLTWKENDVNQNVFYLHGSLHIYKSGNKIRKYITNRRKVDFINEIQRHSGDNFSKLSAVFEHTTKDKKKKIDGNRYLKYCLENLGELSGKLTIIGWSMGTNDQHLIDAINASQVEEVDIYYHGEKPKNCPIEARKINHRPSSRLPFASG